MSFQQRRVHVGPYEWDNGAATDYWLQAASGSHLTSASSSNPGGLIGWPGWLSMSAIGATAGAAGDFNSSGDFTPTFIAFDAGADQLRSARLFGGYDQFQRVAEILLYVPTLFVCEFYMAWPTHTNNDTTTYIGLHSNGSDAAGAGSVACITASGAAPPTNFFLTSDNGSDSGIAVDTAWHRYKIEVGSATTEWFVDGASQGTITTEADIWPTSFTGYVGGSNRMSLGWVHLFYR